MSADLGTGPAGPVFRPVVGRPATEDPLVASLVEASIRLTKTGLPKVAVLLAFIVLAASLKAGSALLPLYAVAVTLIALMFFFLAYSSLRVPLGARRRLVREPVREVVLGGDDLLETRRSVYVRLAPDSWHRMRLGSVVRDFLARERRVFVLGPDESGRALVFLPGSPVGGLAKTRREPPRGAKPVSALPWKPGAPKDDPVRPWFATSSVFSLWSPRS
ncbi:hypothetical protein FNH05_18135 [Amycolatopsis rhizosphaerae]|uniref:Uncharacterized protein n=1 Tax=Amycolatopsis rhizosphaerae TaxID=2053003 RepID=A0A558CH67_9PSEU|nr:hypothetical protein [Amycolatopsis rhizosphaerae]TVT48120.1 hypothetical protein FNH05_18135 [Amycolatopsis rhizosphaerae]